MPVGAIIGGAVIAGGATIAASHSNSKAINNATAAQQDSTAQQIAYQTQARAENTAALSPFMARGNVAGDTINAALGLGGPAPGTTAAVGTAGQNPQQAALAAYEIFKQSTGYQSRLNEGDASQRALYAGNGVYQSGARDKALARFNQDYASREFGNWMGGLQGQQQIGFGGASALAGVSQNFANNASNISQNGANTAASAAALTANNNNAALGSLTGILGNTTGALSSYKSQAWNPYANGYEFGPQG